MIKINNITKTFPGVFRPVLNSIDLTIKHGDFCTLIGANGSGKSTLLKVINGEYIPEFGTVEVAGRIAQVGQDINLSTIPELTLLENIALSNIAKPKLALFKRYKTQILQQIKSLGLGLETFIDQKVRILSGGQRQAIAILMAMISDYQILLLDEPTSALDPKMQHKMMKYTAEQILLHKRTCIMITHNMDDALKFGNRLLVLHQGQIVLNIADQAKEKLKRDDLLALFHKYEDKMLLTGDENDN